MDWNAFAAMLGLLPQKQGPMLGLGPTPQNKLEAPVLPQPQLRGLEPVSFLGTRG